MGEAKRRRQHDEGRAMKGTCQTCDHFAALEGECREDARKASPMVGPKGEIGVFSYWPRTEPRFWCGKYVPDANVDTKPAAASNIFAHLGGNGNA